MLGYTFRKPQPDRIMMSAIRTLLCAALLMLSALAHAQLSIEITGSSSTRYPVAIPLLENEGVLPSSVSDIVRADLERSGLFGLIDTGLASFPESVMPD